MASEDLASETCRVDKVQIGVRINGLISRLSKDGEKDKEINAKVAQDIGLNGESIRLWRKGLTLPRLDKLEPLCKYLKEHGVEARPESILFGFSAKEVHIRERIAEEGDELELLRTFRRSNAEGRKVILDTAKALQAAHPNDPKVVRLESRKKRRKS